MLQNLLWEVTQPENFQPIYLRADRSLWCVVDPEDWAWASQFIWNYKPQKSIITDHFYAKRNVGPARTPLYLHREIMLRCSCPINPNARYVDHISGNTLDNRRRNLRWATAKENRHNFGHKSFLIPIPELYGDSGIPF